jgi:prepilin-type N-terminal cleavage/methylation domain-containing protein
MISSGISKIFRSHLKNRILAQNRGGAEFQTGGILLYVEDLRRGTNKDIRPKDIFEMTSNIIHGQQAGSFKNAKGFTLIELIVVMALLGIMIAFSVPRLHGTIFLDDTKKSSRWLIGKVQAPKEAAIQNQKQYVLHIDLETDRVWDADESMSDDDLEEAALNAHALPDTVKLMDVEFPIAGKISTGRADIRFYKTGYTDKALIHMRDDNQELSFLIEPFLPQVKLFEKYATFDD